MKPHFDGIFTQQYLYQKLLESDNYCWNYRWWLGGILFLRHSVVLKKLNLTQQKQTFIQNKNTSAQNKHTKTKARFGRLIWPPAWKWSKLYSTAAGAHLAPVAEVRIQYSIELVASDILVKWACGTDNGCRATRTDKNQFHISTPFMRKTDRQVDILQCLKTVASQHRIRHYSNTTTTNMWQTH